MDGKTSKLVGIASLLGLSVVALIFIFAPSENENKVSERPNVPPNAGVQSEKGLIDKAPDPLVERERSASQAAKVSEAIVRYKFLEAENIARKALEEREDYSIRLLLIQSLIAQQKWGEAVLTINELLDSYPLKTDTYRTAFALEKISHGHSDFHFDIESYLGRDRSGTAAKIVYAEELLKKHEVSEALRLFEEAARDHPDFPEPHRYLSVHYRQVGDHALALEHAKKWLQYETNREMRATAELQIKELEGER